MAMLPVTKHGAWRIGTLSVSSVNFVDTAPSALYGHGRGYEKQPRGALGALKGLGSSCCSVKEDPRSLLRSEIHDRSMTWA